MVNNNALIDAASFAAGIGTMYAVAHKEVTEEKVAIAGIAGIKNEKTVIFIKSNNVTRYEFI